jgi:hypothetical protein
MHYKKSLYPQRGGIMTNETGKTTTAFAALSLMLSACGGGDGAGTASFTSWSTIQPSSTVVAQGLSQEVDSVGNPSAVSRNSSATMSLDADGKLSRLVIRSLTTTIDVDLFSPGGETGFLEATSSTDSAISVIFADPIFPPRFPPGYDYQTFGVWESTATDTVGYFSVGVPTVGSNIPTTSTATFTGSLAGFYFDPDGLGFFAFGDVNVTADFASRTLVFGTENTVIRPDLLTAGNAISRNDLNLSGTLSYASGTNSFSGSVESAGSLISNSLTGSSSGQFYGPNAEELGGVFFVQDLSDPTSLESYSGAYGAKTTAP